MANFSLIIVVWAMLDHPQKQLLFMTKHRNAVYTEKLHAVLSTG